MFGKLIILIHAIILMVLVNFIPLYTNLGLQWENKEEKLGNRKFAV